MADHQTPIIDASEYVELDDKSYLRKEINLNYEHFVKIAEKPENKDYRFKKTEFLNISEIKKIPVREELLIIDANTGKVFGLTQEVGDAVSVQTKNEMISKAMGQLNSPLGESHNPITDDVDFQERVKKCWVESILSDYNYRIPETEKGIQASLHSWALDICGELDLEDNQQLFAVKSILGSYLLNMEMFKVIKGRNIDRENEKKKDREELANSLSTDEKYLLCNTKALKLSHLMDIIEKDGDGYYTKKEDIPYILDRAEQIIKERIKKI